MARAAAYPWSARQAGSFQTSFPVWARDSIVNGSIRKVKMASFSMGTAAGTDIPIEHLDYDYIGKCSNVREVEKMLKALR